MSKLECVVDHNGPNWNIYNTLLGYEYSQMGND